MYQTPFVPTREADYFKQRESTLTILDALSRDLPRFLPQNIFSMYKEDAFSDFISTLKEVTSDLINQGMKL